MSFSEIFTIPLTQITTACTELWGFHKALYKQDGQPSTGCADAKSQISDLTYNCAFKDFYFMMET